MPHTAWQISNVPRDCRHTEMNSPVLSDPFKHVYRPFCERAGLQLHLSPEAVALAVTLFVSGVPFAFIAREVGNTQAVVLALYGQPWARAVMGDPMNGGMPGDRAVTEAASTTSRRLKAVRAPVASM